LPHIMHIIAVAEHPELPAAAKSIGCYLTRHSDDSGAVAVDEAGHNLHIPAGLGLALGIPEPTARRALALLHDLGLVEWRRQYRGRGAAGTVRVLLPTTSA
jgi:hypothetical protein